MGGQNQDYATEGQDRPDLMKEVLEELGF